MTTTLADWRDLAACGAHDPDLWLSPRGRDSTDALRAVTICQGCPVAEPCHADALDGGPAMRRSTIRAAVVYDDIGKPRVRGALTCARPGCPERFIAWPGRRYCSDTCREISQERRRQARLASQQNNRTNLLRSTA